MSLIRLVEVEASECGCTKVVRPDECPEGLGQCDKLGCTGSFCEFNVSMDPDLTGEAEGYTAVEGRRFVKCAALCLGS
jgi:hypothetical protein